jgi:hypothetical protein
MDLPDPVVLMKGTLPPIAAALVLVGLFGARWLPLAVAIGLGVAYGLLKKEWPLLPHQLWAAPDGRQWLLWGVVAATLAALLENFRAVRGRAAAGTGVVLAALGVWLLVSKQAARWDAGELLLFVGVGGLAAALVVLVCRRIVASAPAGIGVAVVFSFVLSFDAVLLTMGRSGLLAQMCGATAAALGTAIGTAMWRRPFALGTGDGTWLGIAHALFLLSGVHLAYLTWPAVCSALAAPLPLLLLGKRFADRHATWTVSAILLSGPLLALAFFFAQL